MCWKCPASVNPYVKNLSHFRLPLHALPQMFPWGFSRSVVSFWSDSKPKIATLASDWSRHFRLLRKHCMRSHQNCQKCSSACPEEELLLFVTILFNLISPEFFNGALVLSAILLYLHTTVHSTHKMGVVCIYLRHDSEIIFPIIS